MFSEKINAGVSGILTYGITPPKAGTADDKLMGIAKRTVDRLVALDLDALIVYDVQDESARTSEERPFPFLNAMDPFDFASAYLEELKIPKVIYRPAGKFSKEELSAWLKRMHEHDFYPVFVGVPANGYPAKTSLPEAYALCGEACIDPVIGAVTIPERHAILNDEDRRMLEKARYGVSYFISQCVFNVNYAKRMIDDLCRTCAMENKKVPVVVFTLTACGSEKTLRFMEWLGIHIPDEMKAALLASDDMLERSVGICLEIASELIAFCKAKGIPFGFNVESVAIRKDEIEASVRMLNQVGEMLHKHGLRGAKSCAKESAADVIGLTFSRRIGEDDNNGNWEVIQLQK